MWDMPAMSFSRGDHALKIGADLKQFMRVNQVVGSKDLTPTSISSSWWVQYDYFKYCAQSDLYFNFYYLTSTTSVSRFGQTSHLRWHTAQQGGDLAECKVELSSRCKLNSPSKSENEHKSILHNPCLQLTEIFQLNDPGAWYDLLFM